jgi:hypothetical protein
MSDTIIAALIGLAGVIVTVLITKFEEITALFRKSSMSISGVWEGESYEITYGPETTGSPPIINHTPTILDKYIVTVKQRGEKFEAEMVETAVFKKNLVPRKYKWKGKMIKDYIVYDSDCEAPNTFYRSTAMLNINKQGNKLEGYFVAVSGSESISRPWVGFAIITRKV